MAKPALEIKLSNLDTTFEPGHDIEGEVIVHHEGKTNNGPLTLGCEWYTHGRGNADSARVHEEVLRDEDRSATSSRYRFSFKAPDGPFTYHGENLNVDWRLVAELDVPWALDPKEELGFGLVPGSEVHPPPAELSRRYEALEKPSKGKGMGCGLLFGLAFTLFPMIHLSVGIGTLFSEKTPAVFSLMFILVPLIFIGVGLSIIFFSLRNWIAAKKLGQVHFSLDPVRPFLGAELRCRLRIEPKAGAHVNAATFKVVCREVCVRGAGTRKQTFIKELFQEERPLIDGPVDLQDGVPFEKRAGMLLPENLPVTFHADDNKIEWSAEVHVDVASWPDWAERRPMLVWLDGRRQAPGF